MVGIVALSSNFTLDCPLAVHLNSSASRPYRTTMTKVQFASVVALVTLPFLKTYSQGITESGVHAEGDRIVLGHRGMFSLDDLFELSKDKYGFIEEDGTVDPYYGDFDLVSAENSLFDFQVGCGSRADIVRIGVKIHPSKVNCFIIYIPQGGLHFGSLVNRPTEIGELTVLSESEIHGRIELCLEKGSSCCGPGDGHFSLKRIATTSEPALSFISGFTAMKYNNLPPGFKDLESGRDLLDDDRIVHEDDVQYIGGYLSNGAEVFFINNSEVFFTEVLFEEKGSVVTKTLKSGDYTIVITWDEGLTTGAYREGEVSLFSGNTFVSRSPLVIAGW